MNEAAACGLFDGCGDWFALGRGLAAKGTLVVNLGFVVIAIWLCWTVSALVRLRRLEHDRDEIQRRLNRQLAKVCDLQEECAELREKARAAKAAVFDSYQMPRLFAGEND